ncbi:hypothetical protein ACFY12_10800 [Streptomyces sp. NPDC001339]|uniref:hypothetical protein n=1 Tax=Streptomyces sp. NPDC001339 TaxID=3364563 RepID=UPI0036CF59C6
MTRHTRTSAARPDLMPGSRPTVGAWGLWGATITTAVLVHAAVDTLYDSPYGQRAPRARSGP